jgi:hypothetical protein
MTNQPDNKRKKSGLDFPSESIFNFNFNSIGDDATLFQLENEVEIIDL